MKKPTKDEWKGVRAYQEEMYGQREHDKWAGDDHRPIPNITKKFSAFQPEGGAKEHRITVNTNETAYETLDQFPKFVAKEEYTRVPFDPNIRYALPQMPNHLVQRYMNNEIPTPKQESQYVAFNKQGVTYHLFNAKYMPIGRIAVLVSKYIRGKHKPTFSPTNHKNGDKCIVVNMSDPLMTGRKRRQKLYRHHTGYPGGLIEQTFRTVLEKDPERILIQAVKGMLPKNKQRDMLISDNLHIFRDGYHNYWNKVPQFKEQLPDDINQDYGIEALDKETTIIEYSSADKLPEEFADFKTDIDPQFDSPLAGKWKTHRMDHKNLQLGNAYKKSYKNYRRFKEHRHDSGKW